MIRSRAGRFGAAHNATQAIAENELAGLADDSLLAGAQAQLGKILSTMSGGYNSMTSRVFSTRGSIQVDWPCPYGPGLAVTAPLNGHG